jgi:transcription elongation factor GreA
VTEAGGSPDVWLTQEAHDRLAAELEYLTGPGRTEIARKIEAARAEGDLRENGGYHAAKEEQGKREARIRQLTALLRDARVGAAPVTEGVAGPGMVVEVEFSDGERERFLLGSREEGGLGNGLTVYSPQSPLGRALTGRRVGDETTYELPNGSTMAVRLLSADPYPG